jgi:hypothetical protein
LLLLNFSAEDDARDKDKELIDAMERMKKYESVSYLP